MFFIRLQWTEKAKILASYSGSPPDLQTVCLKHEGKSERGHCWAASFWILGKAREFSSWESKRKSSWVPVVLFEWGRELSISIPTSQVFPQRKSDSALMWGPRPAGKKVFFLISESPGRIEALFPSVKCNLHTLEFTHGKRYNSVIASQFPQSCSLHHSQFWDISITQEDDLCPPTVNPWLPSPPMRSLLFFPSLLICTLEIA